MSEQDDVSGKGRATPSRKEAEAARKARMKAPTTRKEQSAKTRAARAEARRKQQQGLASGDERFLPPRDQGPERRFVRDYVDARWNISEFLLPILILILALSFLGSTADANITRVANALWAATIVMVVVDSFMLLRGLKRGITARFGPGQAKGQRFYAFLRSTQFRRMRLPKPGVKRGEAPRS